MLKENLEKVEENIQAACDRAGRKRDEVTLIGKDGEEFISIETFGDLSGRFSYEFACDISKRVPRVYIKDGREWGDLTFFE